MGKKIFLIVLGTLLILAGLFFFALIPIVKSNPVFDGEENVVEKFANKLAYFTVSELKTEEEYKNLWEYSMKNMQEKGYYEMLAEDEGGEVKMKVDGEDLSLELSSEDEIVSFNLKFVKKGDYAYFGSLDEGIKILQDNEGFESLEGELSMDDFTNMLRIDAWDEDEMEYKGFITVGSRKHHVYYSGLNKLEIWIDALAMLPVKFEDDLNSKALISYDSVVIEEPEGYEDISELSKIEQEIRIEGMYYKIVLGDFENYYEYYESEFDNDWDWDDIVWE